MEKDINCICKVNYFHNNFFFLEYLEETEKDH